MGESLNLRQPGESATDTLFVPVPSYCLAKVWEDSNKTDPSILTNGLAGRKTGMSTDTEGRWRDHIVCLRCAASMIFDGETLSGINDSECPLGQPDVEIIDFYADTEK